MPVYTLIISPGKRVQCTRAVSYVRRFLVQKRPGSLVDFKCHFWGRNIKNIKKLFPRALLLEHRHVAVHSDGL